MKELGCLYCENVVGTVLRHLNNPGSCIRMTVGRRVVISRRAPVSDGGGADVRRRKGRQV